MKSHLNIIVCEMATMILSRGRWVNSLRLSDAYMRRKLTIIGSDNGLSPGRRQAIIWTTAEILLIGLLGTNFSEISIRIETFSFKKIHLKMSSAKWCPFCLGPNRCKEMRSSFVCHPCAIPLLWFAWQGDIGIHNVTPGFTQGLLARNLITSPENEGWAEFVASVLVMM